jgi:putative hemolysin
LGVPDGAAQIGATGLVVVLITFLTIIFGELVPKRLGQMYPETVARLVSQPMNWLSSGRAPAGGAAEGSTKAVLQADGHARRASRAR